MAKIKTIVKFTARIPWKLRLLTLPYQFCFSAGHSHLTDKQITDISKTINLNDGDDVIGEYEKRFAALNGSGYGISFAAGRMAFYSLLKVLDIGAGDEVILPGFTCSVMVNAVWRSGAAPVFADIDSQTYGSSVQGIKARITSRTRLIVAQHSFGIPCRIADIAELARKRGIFLMEDSAISLDSAIHGVKVGNWGDASLFSTDHTKPLNTLIGGFLYTSDRGLYMKVRKYSEKLSHLDKAHQNRLLKRFLFERKAHMPPRYPRSVFMSGLKFAARRFISKNASGAFLDSDYSRNRSAAAPYPYPAKIPSFLAQLGLFELERWGRERKRRRDLLGEYIKIAIRAGVNNYLPGAYFDPDMDITPLRFVFQYPDQGRLMAKTSRFVDLDGMWFRAPVICCPEGPESLGYGYGSCPVSEEVGKRIVNWPCVVPQGWERMALESFRRVFDLN